MSERVVTVGGPNPTRLWTEVNQETTGDEFYVSSVIGDNGRYGSSKASSVADIATALDRVTENNEDIIHLLPGHAETISEAAGLALDVDGVTLRGHGYGTLQPTITFDTIISADMDVDAANVVMENIHFVANFADITAAIDVNATDFALRFCRFSEAAVDMNAKIWIQDAAAMASNRISIEYCRALMIDAANTHFINYAGTGDGHRVIGNELIGDWGTMAVGGAGIVTFITILDNVIYNAASDNDSCINLPATTTGIVMRNMTGGAAAQANGITATACAIAENYYGVISEDLSALLEPVVT